jgi:outer membrane protein assembly factor BamD
MMGKKFFTYMLLAVMATSCGEYQEVLKSKDLDFKFGKAVEYYEAGEYNKAYPIFDELITLYRGTEKAQEVYFYYANTLYLQKDYILAGYHFKNFYKTFPQNEQADEAAYLTAYCYYLEAPTHSLDQAYTYKAINELQLFINTHPGSDKIDLCNEYMEDLRGRLEQKSYEIAKQYYKTRKYKAAMTAFTTTLSEYPDTPYREEAMYLKAKAAFKLAENSVAELQKERFIEANTALNDLEEIYPESEYLPELRKLTK